jgi:hypothetical protein
LTEDEKAEFLASIPKDQHAAPAQPPRRDLMAELRALGGRIRATWDDLKAWFRGTFLGRLIWVARNMGVDFKTKTPEYNFRALTQEEAKYVEELFVRFGLGCLNKFYEKYPRGQFNLPPKGAGLEQEAEAWKLIEAACDALYLEIAEDGKRLYTAPNPFFKKVGQLSEAVQDLIPGEHQAHLKTAKG